MKQAFKAHSIFAVLFCTWETNHLSATPLTSWANKWNDTFTGAWYCGWMWSGPKVTLHSPVSIGTISKKYFYGIEVGLRERGKYRSCHSHRSLQFNTEGTYVNLPCFDYCWNICIMIHEHDLILPGLSSYTVLWMKGLFQKCLLFLWSSLKLWLFLFWKQAFLYLWQEMDVADKSPIFPISPLPLFSRKLYSAYRNVTLNWTMFLKCKHIFLLSLHPPKIYMYIYVFGGLQKSYSVLLTGLLQFVQRSLLCFM